jgi:hypothetical protein
MSMMEKAKGQNSHLVDLSTTSIFLISYKTQFHNVITYISKKPPLLQLRF